jgi:thiamine-phosphate pyrophosphorylase
MTVADWRTYFVTEQAVSPERDSVTAVRAAVAGGVDVVQLRDKALSARERYELGRELRTITAEAGVDFVVDDRVDLAQALDADGVHVGQSDLPVPVARDLLGPDAVVGCSVSTVAEAERAAAEGADYLGVGAVYDTDSKDVDPAEAGLGPERVREIAAAVDLPLVAIGGIDAANAAAVVEAGADAVAVISAIAAAEDPETATRRLRDAVAEGHAARRR